MKTLKVLGSKLVYQRKAFIEHANIWSAVAQDGKLLRRLLDACLEGNRNESCITKLNLTRRITMLDSILPG
jgi:hypothetical protein